MNKKERAYLQKLRDELQNMQEVEQEKYENAPDNLLDSERYERIEETANKLEEAVDALDEILEA